MRRNTEALKRKQSEKKMLEERHRQKLTVARDLERRMEQKLKELEEFNLDSNELLRLKTELEVCLRALRSGAQGMWSGMRLWFCPRGIRTGGRGGGGGRVG